MDKELLHCCLVNPAIPSTHITKNLQSMKRTGTNLLAVAVAASVLFIGCGSKSEADKTLDEMEEITNEGLAILKKEGSLEKASQNEDFKKLNDRADAVSRKLDSLDNTFTEAQKKRAEEIKKKAQEGAKEYISK